MKQVLLILILMLFLCSCEVDSGVEIIDLRGTEINEIPNSVFKNTKLKELHIGSDGYTLYPPLAFVPNQTMTLSEIPEKLSRLQGLTRLSINSSRIKELPSSISKLIKLHYLDLSCNKDLIMEAQINKINSISLLDTLVVYGTSFSDEIREELLSHNSKLTIIDNQFITRMMEDNMAK